MWLSLNWIKEFTNYELDCSADELANKISLSVAEVEGIKVTGENLKQVTVAEVLETKPHPDADKLKIATIDDGQSKREIVCGAPNCIAGIKVPFADLGTVLLVQDKHGNESKFEIKKANIRGVDSEGMLCSAKELGIAEDADGLLILDNSLKNGTILGETENFKDVADTLFEVDNKSLTHRPDLWGHYGFSREFSAIFDLPLKDYPSKEITEIKSRFSIINELPNLCRRYSGLEIKNVKVKPSPQWVQNKLNAAGIGPVNNLVDVTNFILLELGQPMHAFDTDKLSSTEVKIRPATAGEIFKSLDEQDYTMENSDMVIDFGGEACALAGVMGGLNSSISDSTVNIFFESANFAPAAIRKTSVKFGLRSDSSLRFEKSLDPENTTKSLLRAWQLISEMCPEAELVGGITDSYDSPYPDCEISTSTEYISKRLGKDISADFINTKLRALGFQTSGDLCVKVPSWRNTKDVSIADDLVEEIGRIYGYDNIEAQTPSFKISVPITNHHRNLERKLKLMMCNGYGYTEIMQYPWVGPNLLKKFNIDPTPCLKLANPVSEDAVLMRPTPVPQFIQAISENLKYYKELRMFAFGRIYDTSKMTDLLPEETSHFTGVFVPEFEKKSLQENAFYDVKAMLLDILNTGGVSTPQVRPLDTQDSWVHPGINIGFYRGKECFAKLYKLHPLTADQNQIKANAYIFEINFEALAKCNKKLKYTAITKFPGVPFDISILADEKLPAGEVEKIIKKSAGKLMDSIEVFSIFKGQGVPEGKKSISFRMAFKSPNHTLTPEEISTVQNKVMADLDKAGYPLK